MENGDLQETARHCVPGPQGHSIRNGTECWRSDRAHFFPPPFGYGIHTNESALKLRWYYSGLKNLCSDCTFPFSSWPRRRPSTTTGRKFGAWANDSARQEPGVSLNAMGLNLVVDGRLRGRDETARDLAEQVFGQISVCAAPATDMCESRRLAWGGGKANGQSVN